MRVIGPNTVGRPMETDPTLFHYASAITEQKKFYEFWLKTLTGFKLCATAPNNTNNMPRYATGCGSGHNINIQHCCVRLLWGFRLYSLALPTV